MVEGLLIFITSFILWEVFYFCSLVLPTELESLNVAFIVILGISLASSFIFNYYCE